MGRSIWTEINELRDLTERLVAGEFPTRSPLGPGQIQSKNIRARAVTAPLINVSNLEAVNTQTGSLNVDGTVEITTAGKLVSGTSTSDFTTFSTSPGGGLGYYLTYDATYGAKMAVGDFNNVSGQYMKWDGLALTIKGVVVASSGSIAGWTITTDAIENSGGDVGMASSGNGGYAFWAGNASPGSAEFSVTAAGALVATSATITGAITASSGSITGLLEMGTSGGINMLGSSSYIRAGQTAYDTGTGFYLRGGTLPLFSLGDSAGAKLLWTGSALQVTGAITATSGSFTGGITLGSSGTGSLSSGQSAYDTGTGFWLERNAGTPRFSIGNSAGNKLTWNGTTLAITGTITSTAGSIGGWTIDSAGLRTGSGGTTRGMDTGSTAFYAGSATPGSAPFRVSTAGALVATNATITGAITATSGSFTGTLTATAGTIGGWDIDGTAGLTLGTTSTTRGISTGATAFYAGNATPGSAPFRVTSGGALTATSATITGAITATSGSLSGLTVNGTVTVGSGGKIAFGSAAGDYLDNNLLHFEVGTTEDVTIEWKNGANAPYGYIGGNASSTVGRIVMKSQYDANTYGFMANEAGSNYNEMWLHSNAGTTGGNSVDIFLSADDTSTSSRIQFAMGNPTVPILQLKETNRSADFYGFIYPGSGTATQASRYIKDNGTYMDFQGPVNIGNSTTGGSNANWSSFTVANIPDKTAAYVVVYINGSAYRIPLYGNA